MAEPEVTESALTKLLESRARFLNFLNKRVSSPDVAEELLQNAFLKTVQKSGDIRDSESIVAWFYRVLRNSVIDHYRSSGRNQEELTGVLDDLEKYASATPEPANEVCRCIHPLLARHLCQPPTPLVPRAVWLQSPNFLFRILRPALTRRVQGVRGR